MTISFRSFGVAIALLCSFGCEPRVVRPQGAPTDATFVRGAKIGWWQRCTLGTGSEGVHCQIWNGAGLVLVDEEFLPYDGGPTPTAEELKIPPDTKFAGPDRIFLANNRVLLPRSRYDELKKFIDWLEGKAAEPR